MAVRACSLIIERSGVTRRAPPSWVPSQIGAQIGAVSAITGDRMMGFQ